MSAAQQFPRLVIDAVESPASVDRNALLSAADAFLVTTQGEGPEGMEFARAMAHRACDFGVFADPTTYAALRRAAELFRMRLQVNST